MKKIYIPLALALLLQTSCESYTDPTYSAPTVTTGAADEIYRKGATLHGSYTDGSPQAPAVVCGILLSEMQSMPEPTDYPASHPANGVPYSVEVKDLTPGKTYYYQSYAGSGISMVKGEVLSFTTTTSNPPKFDTPEVSEKKATSCVITSKLLDDGDCNVLMSGYLWKESTEEGEEPTFQDSQTSADLSSGLCQATFKNLRPGRRYLIRPFGINEKGVGIGKTIQVTMDAAGAPALADLAVSGETRYSATFTSNVLDPGTSACKEVGFCWSTTNRYPTAEDDRHQTVDLPANGDTFQFQLEADEQLTTYYVRAFAKNEEETGYSEPFEFTTGRFIELESYTLNGNVTTVYGRLHHPHIAYFHLLYAESESALDDPSGSGVISSSLQPNLDADRRFSESRIDLKPSTTYYVRAVTNGEHPIVSNTMTIQTSVATPDEPVLTLMPATQSEAVQAEAVIRQIVNDACQSLMPGATVQGIAHEDGSLSYTLDVVLDGMSDGQSLPLLAPHFVGFASTISPSTTRAGSESAGQRWLSKAEEQLGKSYGMKNQGQSETVPGIPGKRLTGYRVTMEFTVKTMEYDQLKGQVIYADFTKVDQPTYKAVESEPEPEVPDTPITEGDGTIDDSPIEDL